MPTHTQPTPTHLKGGIDSEDNSFNVLNMSAYVSIRQHTSTYVSIREHVCHLQHRLTREGLRRQHMSAYVSIRQHTCHLQHRLTREGPRRQHT